jgi:hypothetical protein
MCGRPYVHYSANNYVYVDTPKNNVCCSAVNYNYTLYQWRTLGNWISPISGTLLSITMFIPAPKNKVFV